MTACFMENEIEIESAKWASSLILYVIGETPTIKDLNTDIANQWKVSHPPEIFYHSEGYFVIRFKEMEDRNRVLYSGPSTIANKPVIEPVIPNPLIDKGKLPMQEGGDLIPSGAG